MTEDKTEDGKPKKGDELPKPLPEKDWLDEYETIKGNKRLPELRPKDNIGKTYLVKILIKPSVIRTNRGKGHAALKMIVELQSDGIVYCMFLHIDLARKVKELEKQRGTLRDALVNITCLRKEAVSERKYIYVYSLEEATQS